MKNPNPTTRTSVEIEALFETAFKAVEPAEKPKTLTPAERLAAYRKAILKQRRRGLTWQQIAEVMSGPIIAEPVSARLLREAFGEKPKAKPTAAQTAAPTAAPVAPVAPKPARPHLILDPLTGRPIAGSAPLPGNGQS